MGGSERAASGAVRKGPVPQFALAEVLAAARGIVEATGAPGLTMRRLANELGVSPMALYRYVANKDELLVLLLNESVASVVIPSVQGGPREEIVAIYTAMRSGLAEQSWALDALVRGRLTAPAALPLLDRLYGAFAACGLNTQRAVAVNRMLWNMMIGDLIASRAVPAAQTPRDEMIAGAEPASMPHLAKVASEWAKSQSSDTFVEDLKALIAVLCP